MQITYEWEADLETGNEEIDAQHKQLFAALNNLIAAYEQGKAPSEIQKTIEFLIEYIFKHFSHEEKLQEDCGYPYIIEHKNAHGILRRQVVNLVNKFDIEGYSDKFVEYTIHFMIDWFAHHIKVDDFKLAAYIREKKQLK